MGIEMNEIELKEKIKLLREQNRDLKAKNAGLLELYRETNDPVSYTHLRAHET